MGVSRGRTGLAAAVAAALATALLVVVSSAQAIEAHSEPGAASLLLQQSDVPGYTIVPASQESLTDANDEGPNQAFIQCAGSTPLLDQFDSGRDSQATVGTLWGLGANPFGAPEYIIGSVVFDDGSTTDAEQTIAALQGSTFQNCWASTQDALNKQQGLVVPLRPSIVTPLQLTPYGDATSGFTVDQQFDAFGHKTDGYESLVAIQEGPIVVMLETDGYGSPFPSGTLTTAISDIAARMGASPQSTTPTTGDTPCRSPLLQGAQPLASTASVSAAAGAPLVYQGWTLAPASATDSAKTYACSWFGRRVRIKDDPYYRGLNIYLSVRGPYAIGAAKPQFETDLKGWGATPASGIGDAYFWLPTQDDAQGIEVLCGDAILEVGMTTSIPDVTAHQQIEEQLARAALSTLGACAVPSPSPSPRPGPTPPPDGECSFTASPETDPSWVDDLNDDFDRHLHDRLPIAVGTINFPGPVYLNFAPGIELTSFDLCASGLLDKVAQEPDSTSDSLAFTAEPAQCGTGSGPKVTNDGSTADGAPCTPESSATVDGESTLGSFDYDGDTASWTAVDPKATPADQSFAVTWQPTYSVLPGISGSWSADDGPEADLTLAEIDIASVKSTIHLVVAPNAALDVDFGPSLSFDVQLSNKSLIQSLGDDLAEGETEKEATDGLGREVEADAEAAVEAEDVDFFGAAPAQIGAQVQSEIDSDLLEAFNAWFASIASDSAVAEELANEGVTYQEVPPDAQAALEATEVPEITLEGALEDCATDWIECFAK